MKRVFTAMVILFACNKGFSQASFEVSLLNPAVSFGRFSGLNYVIDRYNETRQGQNGSAKLSRDMKNFHVLTGLGWRCGINVYVSEESGVYFGMNRIGRSASTYAEGVDVNGNAIRRDLRFTANSTNFEGALVFGNKSEGFMVHLGGSVDFLKQRVYTKLGGADYTRVMDDFSVGLSGFGEVSVFLFNNFALGLRPTYQWAPVEFDYYDVNKAINAATYSKDPTEKTSSGGSNFSLQLMLNFVLGGDD